jgi:hypothetical protein
MFMGVAAPIEETITMNMIAERHAKTFTPDFRADPAHTSWPIRWNAFKDTRWARTCLMSIAIDAQDAGDYEVYCAAFDAAYEQDNSEFIAQLEALFEEGNQPAGDHFDPQL